MTGAGMSWGLYFFLCVLRSFIRMYNYNNSLFSGIMLSSFTCRKGSLLNLFTQHHTFYVPPLLVCGGNCITQVHSLLNLGMMTLSVTNPVWVIKTRLCLANTSSVPETMRYSGLLDGLRKLYYHEGVRGLYKGYIPGLWGTSHGAIQFMLYEEFKKAYANYKSTSIDAKLVMLSLLKFHNIVIVLLDRALLCMSQWQLPVNYWQSV